MVTCAEIAEDAQITVDQLMAYNPWIGSDCDSGLFAGMDESDVRAVCVGVNSTTSTAAVEGAPAPVRSGTPDNCSQYYLVQSGDECAKIQDVFSIDFATFYRWNPSVGKECGDLWQGYAVCVAGGPNI